MSSAKYVHGYSRTEQDRLVSQAHYWRDLILDDLEYSAGQSILEIGCGVGAVLGLIGQSFPEVRLAGVDVQPAQIAYAKEYLPSIGLTDIELVVGDGQKLPWPDHHFDRILMVWIMEHLHEPEVVLSEALRVLKPGGSIMLTETDYATIATLPSNPDYDEFLKRFIEYFNRHGDARVGMRLGQLLDQAGFQNVSTRVIGMNLWNERHSAQLATHIDYLMGFIRPLLDDIVETTKCDPVRLRAGVEYFESLKTRPDAIYSHVFYRAVGFKNQKS